MELGLEKEIRRFYEEMENEESCDLGEMACLLVPKLVSKVKSLEKRINDMTCEKVVNIERVQTFDNRKNIK